MSSRSSRTASERSSSPEDSITRSAHSRKHICPQCQRAFSTSGHLARHSRVHTGQRDHACPFPGCTTRCSRQDNLQQHYRVHLSPKSRNMSTAAARAAMARAIAMQQAQQQHQQRLNAGIFSSPAPTSFPTNFNSGSSIDMRGFSLGHSQSTSAGDYHAPSSYGQSQDYAAMRRASAPAASFFPESTTSYSSYPTSGSYVDGQGSPGPYSPTSSYTYASSTGSAGSDSDASQFFPPSFTAPRSAAPLDIPDISPHSYKAPTPVRLGSSTSFALSEQPQWHPSSGMATNIGGMGLASLSTMPVHVPSGRGTWNA